MSREISKDSEILISFLKEYTLSEVLENRQYILDLKSMHRKVYGYLLFTAELEEHNKNFPYIDDIVIEFYKESASDMMQSVFSWANGSYKSSKLSLRSALETFIKACLGNDNKDVFEEKSLYKLFDNAKVHRFFSSELSGNYFEQIHNSYKILCMTAHSSPTIDLASISSLKMLPRYDAKPSREFSNFFTYTLESMLSTLFLNYYSIVHSMHLLNTSLFLSTLTLTSKREITEYMSRNS